MYSGFSGKTGLFRRLAPCNGEKGIRRFRMRQWKTLEIVQNKKSKT